MNRLFRFTALLLFLSAATALHAQRFDAVAWSKVQTYGVSDLQKLDRVPLGQVLGIKFNYRHKRIRHPKPNWYQGSLWSHDSAAKKQFTFVPVMVPRSALASFEALPTDFRAGGEHIAYGQVTQDAEANKYRFIRLIGMKTETDANGNVTVNW